MSYLTIKDLNPDKHLSVTIAATFVVSAFHICDKPALRKGVITLLEWRSYSGDELGDSHNLLWTFINSLSVPESSLLKATYIPKSISYVFSAVFSATLEDSFSAVYADYAAKNSCYALGLSDPKDKYIHDMLIHLLPIILDYKINASRKSFDNSEKVLELLDEDLKEKFIFNLDILQ